MVLKISANSLLAVCLLKEAVVVRRPTSSGESGVLPLGCTDKDSGVLIVAIRDMSPEIRRAQTLEKMNIDLSVKEPPRSPTQPYVPTQKKYPRPANIKVSRRVSQRPAFNIKQPGR